MSWVMKHRLVGSFERRRSGERLATARVARVVRMRAAGYLKPEAVSALEAIGRRPQINAQANVSIRLRRGPARRDAPQPIADVDGLAGGIDIAQAGEEVGVWKGRFHKEFRQIGRA